jgi:hypothetical protein
MTEPMRCIGVEAMDSDRTGNRHGWELPVTVLVRHRHTEAEALLLRNMRDPQKRSGFSSAMDALILYGAGSGPALPDLDGEDGILAVAAQREREAPALSDVIAAGNRVTLAESPQAQ